MKLKKRVLSLIMAAVFVLALFSGCRMSHYERSEIVDWAKENISRRVVVSDEYFTRPSSDEKYTDRVWTAYIKDMPELEFELISHEYYGMESIDHSIETTYWYEYGKYYFAQYASENETRIIPAEDDFNRSRYKLRAVFGDRQQLSDVIAQAMEIEAYMNDVGCAEFVSFTFEYDDILSQVHQTDVFERARGMEELEAAEDILLFELASYAADYRIGLDMFTQEEIEQAVAESSRRFTVTRSDGTTVSYSDIVLSYYGYGMSFGALYEVLSREGFYPVGTPESFVVAGINGSLYEFSYSFNDMQYENGKTGYYYIKDGEKIAMQSYFYNHFRSPLLEEISGMTFEEM